MEMGNVLITGGNGFVCMNIAQYFLERGINVVTLARHKMSEAAASELSSKSGIFTQVLGDVLDREFLFSIMKEYKITDVINGAAVTPSKELEISNPRQVMDVNCMGLMNTLDAARENHVRRFIYLGSVSGYGETCFTSKVLVEGKSQGNPHSLYELSKYTGERIVQRYRELFEMDAYVARIGDVFGSWERKTGVRSYMSLIYQTTAIALKGGSVILPKPNTIDWVYGKEVAGEIYALMYAPKLQYDIYPVCSGYIWPLTDWCKKLEERFPEFCWRLASDPEEATIRVNQILDNAPMQLTRLAEDTGYQPKYDLDTAFADYMEWINEHPDYVK